MREHKQSRRALPHRTPVLVAAVLLLAAAVGVLAAQLIAMPAGTPTAAQATPESAKTGTADTILYEGQSYRRNTALTTVLLLGIDQSEELRVEAENAVGDNGRSDFMALLILDKTTSTAKLLEISRDTMAEVKIYDASDRYLYSATMQITMQYAFASDARRSCRLTKNLVAKLLGGIPINYTVSLTMEGVTAMVDALGGVELTIPEDYTAIDPLFVKGAALTLDGTQAIRYVRYRDLETSSGNDARMVRQRQMLQAMGNALRAGGQAAVDTVWNAAKPYMESDVDADTIHAMASYTLQDSTYKVPGNTSEAEKHDEYYVDEDALQRLVIQLFYQPVG